MGRNMHPQDGRVVSNFIVQALTGAPPHPVRRRHADALLLLLSTTSSPASASLMDSAPDALTGPVNLGNPGEFTMRQLAANRARPDQLEARPSCTSRCRSDDPRQRQPDITRWPATRWTGRPPIAPARRAGPHHRLLRGAAGRDAARGSRTRALDDSTCGLG